VAPDGTIDRVALGQRVFSDPATLARLEAIVHPAVGEVIAAQVAASTAAVVVIEAIKLLEAGLSRQLCDRVWVTVCTPEVQMARLAVGRGITEAEARRRMANQMPAEQMVAQADRVIETSGTLAETGIKVLTAWHELGLPFPQPQIRPGTVDDAEGTVAVINSVVREGGLTVVDRPFTLDEERAYLRGLPSRARLTVAVVAGLVVGFQSLDLYATYTGAMDHVGVLGTFVLAPLRCRGIGQAMSRATFDYALEAGFTKLVINVRADNPGAQAFYTRLGFRSCGRLARQAFIDGRYVDELQYELFLDL
jgi:RimJ/RimL family protein N-acetyltransferase